MSYLPTLETNSMNHPSNYFSSSAGEPHFSTRYVRTKRYPPTNILFKLWAQVPYMKENMLLRGEV